MRYFLVAAVLLLAACTETPKNIPASLSLAEATAEDALEVGKGRIFITVDGYDAGMFKSSVRTGLFVRMNGVEMGGINSFTDTNQMMVVDVPPGRYQVHMYSKDEVFGVANEATSSTVTIVEGDRAYAAFTLHGATAEQMAGTFVESLFNPYAQLPPPKAKIVMKAPDDPTIPALIEGKTIVLPAEQGMAELTARMEQAQPAPVAETPPGPETMPNVKTLQIPEQTQSTP